MPIMVELIPFKGINLISLGREYVPRYGGRDKGRHRHPLASTPNVARLFIGRAAWQDEGFVSIVRMVEAVL